MGNVPSDFYLESHLINHSVAIEPEGGGGGVIAGTSTGNWDTMVRYRAQSAFSSRSSMMQRPLRTGLGVLEIP